MHEETAALETRVIADRIRKEIAECMFSEMWMCEKSDWKKKTRDIGSFVDRL